MTGVLALVSIDCATGVLTRYMRHLGVEKPTHIARLTNGGNAETVQHFRVYAGKDHAYGRRLPLLVTV